jgi:hypothetical protein
MDGASNVIKMAKHAIHAAKRFVRWLIPMTEFYHRGCVPANAPSRSRQMGWSPI